MQNQEAMTPGLMESDQAGQAQYRNVNDNERRLSMVGGAASLLAALRVGGLPGMALGGLGATLLYRGATGHCPLYARLGKSTARASDKAAVTDAVYLRASITIDKDPAAIYDFWREQTNLPRFMKHIQEIRPYDGDRTRTHWVAKLPTGQTVEWDSHITADVPNERIAWSAVEHADVPNQGEVRFAPAPGGRGTEVRVEMVYQPPGGAAGAIAGRYVNGLTESMVREDLRRLKQVIESGEVATAARVH